MNQLILVAMLLFLVFVCVIMLINHYREKKGKEPIHWVVINFIIEIFLD